MRKLKDKEMNMRGCSLCNDSFRIAAHCYWCHHDRCPYEELDGVKDYLGEYDKPIQDEFNEYIQALSQEIRRKPQRQRRSRIYVQTIESR